MKLEDIVSLCKRRGFIYQSSAIYGGLQGFFDYGPLGVELKNNIKKSWWKNMVYLRDDVYGLDSAVIMNKAVLKNSGHSDTFVDILIDCKDCKPRFKEEKDEKCPACGSINLSDKREFNLMMNVNLGPTHGNYGILRPETAQGIFINFNNIMNSFSPSLPFGIAQIGVAFRNEITPRNFVFRMREFEQMEMEFFVMPCDAQKWHEYWLEKRIVWWNSINVPITIQKQSESELAHYSKATTDLMFEFPHGLEELEGVANRQDFDLGTHSKNQDELNIQANVNKNIESNSKLTVLHEKNHIVPFVIESSAGLDRAFLAVLTSAYIREESRFVLKLHPTLAPVKAAIIPLAKNKQEIVGYAKKLFAKLKKNDVLPIVLEAGGNIGKCYKKHDEIGTPYCITIDFETLDEQKDTVTVRDRDTMVQERMHVDDLVNFLKNKVI